MNNLFLLEGFSNYFNKQVKRFDVLDDYLLKCKKYETMRSVNFVFGDGINTSQILQSKIKINPDYLIVTDDKMEIVGRWFVIENNNLRNGQSRLTLKRDVIAENLDEVLDAEMLIERANVNSDNPLFFVSENESFNQIKQSEHLLKDETGTNWIVGYIARDTNIADEISSVTQSDKIYKQLDGLDIQWNVDGDPTQGGTVNIANNIELMTHLIRQRGGRFWDIYDKIEGTDLNNLNASVITQYSLGHQAPGFITVPNDATTDKIRDKWHMDLYYKKILLALRAYYDSIKIQLINSSDLYDIMVCNNQILYSLKNQKYYKFTIKSTLVKKKVIKLPVDNVPNVVSELDNVASDLTQGLGLPFQRYSDPYEITLNYSQMQIGLQEAAPEEVIKTKISNDRQHLIDAPFDMFAIPYSIRNYNLAQQINLKLASNIYDMQILPYCPVRELIGADGVSLSLGAENISYNHITDSSGKNISYILWASKSSDVFRIKHKIAVPNNNIDLKIYSETTFVRLVSPNYNGVFEFNAAKNGGVDYFEVSYTYKPYSPYIHVNPNFKGLYGQDFNDARGLQCNGDFSVSMTSDAWRQYEVNNKNYQNIFNTEIKTMDENQRLSMISKGISTTLGGIGTGLVAGLFAGNPFIGLGAGMLSTGAGVADLGIAQDMYENSRQAKVDSFNLNLGNIKARPDSLTKVSAHTITNKYFPFIEIYSSTETEKEILKNKLRLTGMKLNFVGKINDIKDSVGFSFVKGTILRINLNEDSHFVQEINNRIQGGIYL